MKKKTCEFANGVTVTVEVPDNFFVDFTPSPRSVMTVSNCGTEKFDVKTGFTTVHWFEEEIN